MNLLSKFTDPFRRRGGNQVSVIHPYREFGVWVFDDARHGLIAEPFVLGMSEIIDRIVAPLPGASRACTLVFSASPLPEPHTAGPPAARAHLSWICNEMGGAYYRLAGADMVGWLCPAMFHYFPRAPRDIHAVATASVTESPWQSSRR